MLEGLWETLFGDLVVSCIQSARLPCTRPLPTPALGLRAGPRLCRRFFAQEAERVAAEERAEAKQEEEDAHPDRKEWEEDGSMSPPRREMIDSMQAPRRLDIH